MPTATTSTGCLSQAIFSQFQLPRKIAAILFTWKKIISIENLNFKYKILF